VTVFDKDDGKSLDELVNYDVVVSATGVPGIIKSTMLKREAAAVDAGTASQGKHIVGDFDDSVRKREDLTITPLKGGVGPLTVAALFDNVLRAARQQAAQESLIS
jgi:methylenetetrahydrofolate dehydrogenase (NADP+)/methenyltetrahydrofolate cyclohydrolase